MPQFSRIVLIGAFLLLLSGWSWAASPAPILETEPNNTFLAANAIDLSNGYAIVNASVNPGGDVDFYAIPGIPAGARIWIETDSGGTQISGATSRDTVIDLLAADGTTAIESDDDDGTSNGADDSIEGGLSSLIAGRTLTTGGTYYIRVRAFSGTAVINPYVLSVALTDTAGSTETEANNTAATADALLGSGDTRGLLTGAIDSAGDVDYHSVVLNAGETVFFAADGDPERDGTSTNLVLELRNSSDTALFTVDSSTAGSLANPAAEGARYTVSSGGTYYIKTRHFSAAGAGSYHLMAAARAAINQAPTASNVQQTGAAIVGQTLVGSYTYSDAESDPEDTTGTGTRYRFVRSADNSISTTADNMDVASGATGGVSQSHALLAADSGGYLFYCVTPYASSGSPAGLEVCSLASGPVSPVASIPTLSEWGMIILSALLIMIAVIKLRRQNVARASI